jgi:hypothetical protein
MVVWDFQDENPDWDGQVRLCLHQFPGPGDGTRPGAIGMDETVDAGRALYIEHTNAHSTKGAGPMDPFGAHPMAMPYLFFTWGKGEYTMRDILEVEAKENNRKRAWIFVLERDDHS